MALLHLHDNHHDFAGACRAMVSGVVVAAGDLVERIRTRAHRGNAGVARLHAGTAGFDECAEDREREVRVPRLDRLVQPVRQLPLARQCAVPLALVIGDTPRLPLRQFEIDQRQCSVDPCTGSDQLFEPRRFRAWSESRKAPAGGADDPGKQRRIRLGRFAQPIREHADVLMIKDLLHGIIPLELAADAVCARWSKGHLKTRWSGWRRYRNSIRAGEGRAASHHRPCAAGTHDHCCLFRVCAVAPAFANMRRGAMGLCVRRDDGKCV
jgi:hypothetical protein